MKIAVSACLLGESIRFDGGHKHDRFITDELGRYAEFVSFCPEDLAFGTPRPSIRLVDTAGGISVRTNRDAAEVTEALLEKSRGECDAVASAGVRAVIFKSKSPSCGLGSTKRYLEDGRSEGKTDGVFAAMCRERFGLLPMEEEGRLQDPWLRENFVMQLFAYDAFERFREAEPGMRELVDFHSRNKFLLQAKDEGRYRELGRIVGNHEGISFERVLAAYEDGFKRAIACKSSIKRNRNVLEHMAGFFKRELTPGEKRTLHTLIADYSAKIVPLITPLSTLKLFAEKYGTKYLLQQTFLDPYPKELALRSHIGSGR